MRRLALRLLLLGSLPVAGCVASPADQEIDLVNTQDEGKADSLADKQLTMEVDGYSFVDLFAPDAAGYTRVLEVTESRLRAAAPIYLFDLAAAASPEVGGSGATTLDLPSAGGDGDIGFLLFVSVDPAEEVFGEGSSNRVVACTDGDVSMNGFHSIAIDPFGGVVAAGSSPLDPIFSFAQCGIPSGTTMFALFPVPLTWSGSLLGLHEFAFHADASWPGAY